MLSHKKTLSPLTNISEQLFAFECSPSFPLFFQDILKTEKKFEARHGINNNTTTGSDALRSYNLIYITHAWPGHQNLILPIGELGTYRSCYNLLAGE